MGYKFYFCTFRNNIFNTPEGKVFCKFGITHNYDVLARFNPNVDNGYQKSLKYLEWDIKADFSMWFNTKEEAKAEEQYWLTEVFPNPGPTKVWVENVLDCPTSDHYTECSGITELRLLSEKQRGWVLGQLYKMRDKVKAKSNPHVYDFRQMETDPGKLPRSWKDEQILNDDNGMTWG